MKAFAAILREIFGLFVDDGRLAVALILWSVTAGLLLPRLALPAGWDGPLLLVGCLAVFAGNLWWTSGPRTLR